MGCLISSGRSENAPTCRNLAQRGTSLWRPGKAVDLGTAVQAVTFTGEGSSQVQDWLLLDVTPVSVCLETVVGILTGCVRPP